MENRGQILSEEERIEILDWINDNQYLLFDLTNSRNMYQFDTNNTTIPQSIWNLRQRIIKREGLENCIQEPTFQDFISMILTKGYIHHHTDPNHDTLFHIRFNVCIQHPSDDFKVFYGGFPVDFSNGVYALSRSGIDMHYSTVNNSTLPRITISFGFLVTKEKLIQLFKPPRLSSHRLLRSINKEDHMAAHVAAHLANTISAFVP
jgi:hypothetical protein